MYLLIYTTKDPLVSLFEECKYLLDKKDFSGFSLKYSVQLTMNH